MSTAEAARRSPFWQTALADIQENLKARWFHFYYGGFAALMAIFFVFSLADSNVMGYTGLGRILLSFIQVTLVILPLFVMISTSRSFVADHESGVWEYLLSWPIGLKSYFWGKALGRLIVIALPMMLALVGAGLYETFRGGSAPWGVVLWFCLFVFAMIVCFLGVGLLISVSTTSQEKALGTAFGLWLLSEALIDSLLLGLLIKAQVAAEIVVGTALLNPLQAFRTASVALFDPELAILGPISYTLVHDLGVQKLLLWTAVWPCIVGLGAASLAAWRFHRLDIAA